MTRFAAVQKERRILDRAETLANDAVASAQAHQLPAAIRQLKEAIDACGECGVKAELHKKLGMIYCQSGDLDAGEKELRAAHASGADDLEIKRALELIAHARINAASGSSTRAR